MISALTIVSLIGCSSAKVTTEEVTENSASQVEGSGDYAYLIVDTAAFMVE